MAYEVLFCFFEVNMKEIGEKLKNTREEIGISIDEAALDLGFKDDEKTDYDTLESIAKDFIDSGERPNITNTI